MYEGDDGRKVIKTPLTILWTKSAKENILIKRSTRWLNTAYIFVVLLFLFKNAVYVLFKNTTSDKRYTFMKANRSRL